jgi:hypothetical protein
LGYDSRSVLRLAIGLAMTLGVCACAHDPEDEICPAAGTGDLVITELRGEQTGGDTYGQWIEVYNATGAVLDLHGAIVDLRSIDGGTRLRLLVRRPLPVGPRGYVVLGDVRDGADRPAHIDYGFGGDFTATVFPAAGAVSISACGAAADEVIYTAPTAGTRSLGLSPPTASGNDDAAAWCTDATPGDDPTQLGLPGTPGEANRPCAVP